jgi:hypothetical protein
MTSNSTFTEQVTELVPDAVFALGESLQKPALVAVAFVAVLVVVLLIAKAIHALWKVSGTIATYMWRIALLPCTLIVWAAKRAYFWYLRKPKLTETPPVVHVVDLRGHERTVRMLRQDIWAESVVGGVTYLYDIAPIQVATVDKEEKKPKAVLEQATSVARHRLQKRGPTPNSYASIVITSPDSDDVRVFGHAVRVKIPQMANDKTVVAPVLMTAKHVWKGVHSHLEMGGSAFLQTPYSKGSLKISPKTWNGAYLLPGVDVATIDLSDAQASTIGLGVADLAPSSMKSAVFYYTTQGETYQAPARNMSKAPHRLMKRHDAYTVKGSSGCPGYIGGKVAYLHVLAEKETSNNMCVDLAAIYRKTSKVLPESDTDEQRYFRTLLDEEAELAEAERYAGDPRTGAIFYEDGAGRMGYADWAAVEAKLGVDSQGRTWADYNSDDDDDGDIPIFGHFDKHAELKREREAINDYVDDVLDDTEGSGKGYSGPGFAYLHKADYERSNTATAKAIRAARRAAQGVEAAPRIGAALPADARTSDTAPQPTTTVVLPPQADPVALPPPPSGQVLDPALAPVVDTAYQHSAPAPPAERKETASVEPSAAANEAVTRLAALPAAELESGTTVVLNSVGPRLHRSNGVSVGGQVKLVSIPQKPIEQRRADAVLPNARKEARRQRKLAAKTKLAVKKAEQESDERIATIVQTQLNAAMARAPAAYQGPPAVQYPQFAGAAPFMEQRPQFVGAPMPSAPTYMVPDFRLPVQSVPNSGMQQ